MMDNDKKDLNKIIVKLVLTFTITLIVPLLMLFYFNFYVFVVAVVILMFYIFFPSNNDKKLFGKLKNVLYIDNVNKALTAYVLKVFKTIDKLF